MHAALAARREYRDDVGVMQTRCRLRFVLEPLELLGIKRRGQGEHLQGYAAAQRNLLGFVDDAHAAAADFADDAEVAENAGGQADVRLGSQVRGRHARSGAA